jgi:hypothetical protein
MGVFVNYDFNPNPSISSTPATIFDTSVIQNSCLLNAINICNKGDNPIRFSMQLVRTQGSPITTLVINQLDIEPRDSVNVMFTINKPPVTERGTTITTESQYYLPYSVTPSVSAQLVGFTNGYTQICDCVVFYTQLNETPLILS